MEIHSKFRTKIYFLEIIMTKRLIGNGGGEVGSDLFRKSRQK